MRRPLGQDLVVSAEAFSETLSNHYARLGLVLPVIDSKPVTRLENWRYSSDEILRSFYTLGRRKIGECAVKEQQVNGRNQRSFSGVSTTRYTQGFGVAIYKTMICEALAEGRDFRTDPEGLNENSVRMWERFVKLGLAVELSPVKLPKTPTTDFSWEVVVPATPLGVSYEATA